MRRSLFLLLGFLMVAATAIAGSNYGRHHHGSRNISFDDDEFASTDCSSMRVTFDDERVPIVSENVPVGNPRALKIRSAQNGGVRIVGGAPAYSVKACKAAGMNTDASQIRVNFNGDEVTASGPDDDNWVVYFIVQTPRAATVSVTANNGPISVSKDRRSVFPHTHRRLSSNEGTVPIAVAITLAHPGVARSVATNTPSTIRLVVVAIADTAP